MSLRRIERPHLYLMLEHGGWVTFEEQLVHGRVECWDHLLWVADQLSMQFRVKNFDVLAVYI